MKRLIYAKLLCLATVFLLMGNLAFSSFSFSDTQKKADDHQLKMALMDDSSAQDDVISEVELEEEEEGINEDSFLESTPLYYFFTKSLEFKQTCPAYVYVSHTKSIPRWLMIRHIII